MITKYCKSHVSDEELSVLPTMQNTVVYFDDGTPSVRLIEDKPDMSQFGKFTDWSLNSLMSSGIDPTQFSSPVVTTSRLEAADKLKAASVSLTSNA